MSSKLIINTESKKEEELKPLLQLESRSSVSNKDEEYSPSCKESFIGIFKKKKRLFSREFPISGKEVTTLEFPPNVICNQKYNAVTFLPFTIYEQFKSFINFYYLVLTLSQFIPVLKVGPIFTYAAPLAFVVGLSISMEAYLDIRRMLRDKQVNSEEYMRLTPNGVEPIPSSDIKVGHFIQIRTNQRIPADMVLVRTTSEVGASFIRTDQLDGETDWKLRRAVQYTHKLTSDADLFHLRDCSIYAEKPRKEIYDFIGTVSSKSEGTEPLNLENTLWSGTVLASDVVIGLVVYTGSETRSALNTAPPATKKGKTAKEINFLTLLLCIIQLIVGIALVALGEFKGIWWLNYFRFLVLISAMIPISMSVNMDIAKFVYAWLIAIDNEIAGCTVRNTTIPEELGRISYLLSDKTGTLTQNEMEFRKLNLGSVNFSNETVEEIKDALLSSYDNQKPLGKSKKKVKMGIANTVWDAISALALCHNVTPVKENEEDLIPVSYQASSPDEVALVKFSERVGLILSNRSFTTITLTNPLLQTEEYEILESFPFSSERKRMGIILRNVKTGVIRFLMKGADTIMMKIVDESDWLEEECDNLAREGLRTLVIGHRYLEEDEWLDFKARYHEAKSSIEDRDTKVAMTIESIEKGLQLVGLTGVEDKLQEDVKKTLEMLRNAGIKIWMLTGDKRETATCIAISSKLVARTHSIFQMEIKDDQSAIKQLNQFADLNEAVLVVDGNSLQYLLDHYRKEFYEASKNAPSVVCCRCSPTQKAEVVTMIKEYSGLQTAAIGDGGNDVSMIQAAHIGIGIVGKEGKQASLASDYSINQFSHVGKLFLYHGRNSYLNSAKMSQFIIHRGTIMSLLQAIYSIIFYMSPIVLYTGGLVMGFSCWYTMCPVFALCINADVTESSAMLYPELYQELRKGRALNQKTFFAMILVSLFQAAVICISGLFISLDYIDFSSVTFTVLCFVLLLNIVYIINIWHTLILISVVVTFAIYPIFIVIQPMYYYLEYTATWGFWAKVMMLTIMASAPIGLIRYFAHKLNPPLYYKVSELN